MEILANPGVVGFCFFILLLLANVPIFASLGLAALGTIVFLDAAPITVIPYVFSSSLDSFPLLATPLFIIAGNLMTRTGIARRLVKLAELVVGRLPGGLALTTLVTGAVVSAMSGSNIATVAALSFLIPAMVSAGYPAPFAVGVVTAGCTFGVVIPPSINYIIYGVITETPIPQLFFSGVGPGLLMLLVLGAYVATVSHLRGYRGEPVERSWKAFRAAFVDAIWGLMAPVIILGGIYGGVFTATEAAAVAVVYLLLVDWLVYRQTPLRALPDVFFQSGQTIGIIVMLIAASSVFSWILQTQGLAAQVSSGLMEWTGGSKPLILLVINAMLVICGAFLEPIAAMYLLVPLLKPTLVALDVDLVHFGAFLAVNLSMAHLTPPVGVSLFLAAKIGGVPFARAARAAIPFVLCETVVILLVTFIPPIALYVPSLMK